MNPLLNKLNAEWLSENIIKTLPIFITINLVAVAIWQLQISHLAMPLVLGVIAGGLVDLDNSLIGRLKNLLVSLVAFAISSATAQLSLGFGWLFIPCAMISTFVLVMLGAIGQRYSTIAFGTLVVAVYSALAYTPESSWIANSLMILAGSALYGVMAILVHLCFPNRLVQENLAKSYQALGDYLFAKAEFFDPDDDNLSTKQLGLAKANNQLMQAFDQTRVSLFYRLRGQHRHARTQRLLRYYFTAQDILERASSSHYQYHELFQQLGNSDLMFRFQRVLERQAAACQQIAHHLRQRQRYQHSPRGEKALQGLLTSLDYHRQQGLKKAHRWQRIAENLRNIEAQLGQIEQENSPLVQERNLTESTRLLGENLVGFRNMWQAIRSQCTFSSQLFRHAVRLSIVVMVCSSIVELFNLDSKGYWILLTAVFVCQPNYSATKKRLVQRVIGTLLGVLVGLSFQYFSPSLEAQLGLLVLTGSLYTFFRFSNYGFSTFFITLLVLISLDVIGLGADSGMLPRIIDTLIGTAIAWGAVSFLWSDWKYLNLQQNLKNTLLASSRYLRHIVVQIQFGYHDQLPYRIARRDVYNHLSALSAVITNMHNEPKKYRHVLTFAPNLLGITYTLLGYISALGAYRIESKSLNQEFEFTSFFFGEGKKVADLISQIALSKGADSAFFSQLTDIEQRLTQFENEQPLSEKALVLLQQLRLIVQLLPQLQQNIGLQGIDRKM